MKSLRELQKLVHQSSDSQATNWHDPFLLTPLLFSALMAVYFVILAIYRHIVGPVSTNYVLLFFLVALVAEAAYLVYIARETFREVIRYRKEGWPGFWSILDKLHIKQDHLRSFLMEESDEELQGVEEDLSFDLVLVTESFENSKLWLKGVATLTTALIAIFVYLKDKTSLPVPSEAVYISLAAIAITFFFSLLSFNLNFSRKHELMRILHVLKRCRSRKAVSL